MTNGIATATVETLTAEVRVLMVGSRQVTLSVARQLDWVDYDDMEPMGRIRMVKGKIHIIGRQVSDGTLVIAPFPRRYDIVSSELLIGTSDLDVTVTGRMFVCRNDSRFRIDALGGSYDGQWFERELLDLCDLPGHEHEFVPGKGYTPCRAAWVSEPFRLRYLAVFERYKEDLKVDLQRITSATDLPLLVLAGLK